MISPVLKQLFQKIEQRQHIVLAPINKQHDQHKPNETAHTVFETCHHVGGGRVVKYSYEGVSPLSQCRLGLVGHRQCFMLDIDLCHCVPTCSKH